MPPNKFIIFCNKIIESVNSSIILYIQEGFLKNSTNGRHAPKNNNVPDSDSDSPNKATEVFPNEQHRAQFTLDP